MNRILKFSAAALASAAIALVPVVASAQQVQLQSFKVTNAIPSATSIVGAPTNAVNPTNNLCLGTGTWLVVPDAIKAMLVIQFTNSATNVGNFDVQMVRTPKIPPSVASDFETVVQPNMSFVVPGNGQLPTVWMTNMDDYSIGSIGALGCYILSNAASAGTIGPLITTNITATSTNYTTNPIVSIQWKYQRVWTAPY
jgi:hypothetical protein